MRCSVKLILLATALVAVTLAWIRVRDQRMAAERQLLGNTGWNEERVSVLEANGAESYLTGDAAGIFHSAHINGPRGLELLADGRPDVQITSLLVGSADVFNSLNSDVLPKLKSLYLNDIDYSQISLAKLESFARLNHIGVKGLENDPFSALKTLPSFERPVTITLQLPTDTDPRLSELENRLPGSTIVIAKDSSR